MQIFKGVASGKQSFREHCATKWLLEANPRNISASKISRYTVSKFDQTSQKLKGQRHEPPPSSQVFIIFVIVVVVILNIDVSS